MNNYRTSQKCKMAGPIVQKIGELLRSCTPKTREEITIA